MGCSLSSKSCRVTSFVPVQGWGRHENEAAVAALQVNRVMRQATVMYESIRWLFAASDRPHQALLLPPLHYAILHRNHLEFTRHSAGCTASLMIYLHIRQAIGNGFGLGLGGARGHATMLTNRLPKTRARNAHTIHPPNAVISSFSQSAPQAFNPRI
jgi:hypothetical protein